MAIDTIARALSGQANATAADAKTTAEQAVSTATAAVPTAVTTWLNANVDPVGSAVVVDSSLSISGAAADAKATGDGLSDLKNAIKKIGGTILTSGNVQLGRINASANGWGYVVRAYAVCTKQGVTIPLIAGDKIYLNDYTNYCFTLSWKTANDEYQWVSGYITSGKYVVETPGDYVITVQLNDTSGTADIDEALAILEIETDSEITRIKDNLTYLENITEDIPEQTENIINLFNAYTITKNVFVTNRGEISYHVDYYLSDYIPVTPTHKYFVSCTASTPAYAYDANKNPLASISGIETISGKGKIIQPNASTYFIRVNGYIGTGTASIQVLPDKFMVVETDSAPSQYVPHRENKVVKANYTGEVSQDIIETENLFDYDTVTSGEYYENGTAVEMARYFHSAPIPVEAGKTYAVTTTLEKIGCFYNGTTYVSNIAKSDYTQTSGVPFSVFTVPNGVNNVIVNGYREEGNGSPSITVRAEAYMMTEGLTVPSNYVPYNKNRKDYLSEEYSRYDGNILREKTLLTFGDSITDAREHEEIDNSGKGYILNYAGYVADRNNMRYYNKGWSGGTITYGAKSMLNSSGDISIYLSDVLYTPDYITIFYGYNDYNQGTVQLGTISDTDPSTFYGAWNNVIQKLKTKYPKAKVGVIVTWGMSQEWHDAVLQVCQKYGIPYLDTCDGQFPLIRKNGTSLLDNAWAEARMAETTYDGTHPNAYGYYLMSTAYENFLRRI